MSLLLENARKHGAEIREQTRVLEFSRTGDGSFRLTLRTENGAGSALDARWVIDASGQSSILAKQHDLRLRHPTHQKVAVFTRYRGAARRGGDRAGNLDIVLGHGGWFWMIGGSAGRANRPSELRVATHSAVAQTTGM